MKNDGSQGKGHKEPFAVVPQSVIRADLSIAELRIMLDVLQVCGDGAKYFKGVRKIATDLCLNKSNVAAALHRLVKKGHLQRLEGGPRRKTHYLPTVRVIRTDNDSNLSVKSVQSVRVKRTPSYKEPYKEDKKHNKQKREPEKERIEVWHKPKTAAQARYPIKRFKIIDVERVATILFFAEIFGMSAPKSNTAGSAALVSLTEKIAWRFRYHRDFKKLKLYPQWTIETAINALCGFFLKARSDGDYWQQHRSRFYTLPFFTSELWPDKFDELQSSGAANRKFGQHIQFNGNDQINWTKTDIAALEDHFYGDVRGSPEDFKVARTVIVNLATANGARMEDHAQLKLISS